MTYPNECSRILLLLLILITSLIIHTSALPLPRFAHSGQQIVLQSDSTTGPTNHIATRIHLSPLPELVDDARSLAAAALKALHSSGKERPRRPSRAAIHGGRTFGFGRTTICNLWTWRNKLKDAEGYRLDSYQKQGLMKQLAVDGKTDEKVEETAKEEVKEEIQEQAQRESTTTKSEPIAEATTPRISFLDALIGEELFSSPAKSSRPFAPTLSANKAVITQVSEPSHTQLGQSSFPSGLQGHLVPFERVPMVEFVKVVE